MDLEPVTEYQRAVSRLRDAELELWCALLATPPGRGLFWILDRLTQLLERLNLGR